MPSTSTTVGLPSAGQPSAEAAANALVQAWASQDTAAALKVATSQAVTALFAVPYPKGLASARGCSTEGTPVTCTFGPPGGANPNDALYSLDVMQAPNGLWYVSAADVEH